MNIFGNKKVVDQSLEPNMSEALEEAADISERLNATVEKVKQQSGEVILFADNQRKAIDLTLTELNTAVNTLNKIAQYSQATYKESEKNKLAIAAAVEVVSETIAQVNTLQDIIAETEKRFKRLDECSQEITAAVDIINNIAERSQLLLINAGMQAASAGEAGKSFVVAAHQVQRLAETSCEETEKIARLVKSIQTDTSDTLKIMNKGIAQVVDVRKQQAEEIGRSVKESQTITESLVMAMKKIAVVTLAQLEVGKNLQEQTQNIQTSAIKTTEKLQQQGILADELSKDVEELTAKINVFKLPE